MKRRRGDPARRPSPSSRRLRLDKRLSNLTPESEGSTLEPRSRVENRIVEEKIENNRVSVDHNIDDVKRVMEEEKRVLAEKARLVATGQIVEGYTAYLGLRVRPTIKQLWEAAPLHVKRAAKHALEAAILAYYLGGSAQLAPVLPASQPIIMNLNIVEARAEAKAEAHVDLDKVVDLLEEILEELRMIRRLAEYPSSTNSRVIAGKAEKLIARIEKLREQLTTN